MPPFEAAAGATTEPRSGWYVSFPSIRLPRCRRPSSSIARATSCASSRALSRSIAAGRTAGGCPRLADDLAGQGHRMHRCGRRTADGARLAGLIVISDPPREDSAGLIAELRALGVRTVMVTGDSAVTAAAIARKVGIADRVCPPRKYPMT